jgi:hypothetical protein
MRKVRYKFKVSGPMSGDVCFCQVFVCFRGHNGLNGEQAETPGFEHPAGILKRKFENNGHGLIL